MPDTCRSVGPSRRITSTAETPARSSSGFSVIWMRPLFMVVLTPSAPMNDVRFSTAGSWRMTRTSPCCSLDMAENETVSGACEMPRIAPVSCTGKKPLGTIS